MNHRAFSRKGGQARSLAKTLANRTKAAAFWDAVRAGRKPPPRRLRVPPSPAIIADLLAAYCRQAGITRLEVFGSIARGQARRGSDIDLLVTFAGNPGLRFFTMEEDMSAILGGSVHLLTRDSVGHMTNPYRRESILRDVQEIYHG